MTSHQKPVDAQSQVTLKLTNTDWINCFKKFTRSELGVLFYLMTIDPERSGCSIDTQSIATALNLSKVTVYRVLKELSDKKIIHLQRQKTIKFS